ncbi:hypothetical protein SAMN06298212_11558 [Ruaniaceae bacterium KH17]|nr:hypothetical protein SAMN06298212_11558 [Ruaniaceae bacterium KH17]
MVDPASWMAFLHVRRCVLRAWTQAGYCFMQQEHFCGPVRPIPATYAVHDLIRLNSLARMR